MGLTLEIKPFVFPALGLKSHAYIFVFYWVVIEELLHVIKNQNDISE